MWAAAWGQFAAGQDQPSGTCLLKNRSSLGDSAVRACCGGACELLSGNGGGLPHNLQSTARTLTACSTSGTRHRAGCETRDSLWMCVGQVCALVSVGSVRLSRKLADRQSRVWLTGSSPSAGLVRAPGTQVDATRQACRKLCEHGGAHEADGRLFCVRCVVCEAHTSVSCSHVCVHGAYRAGARTRGVPAHCTACVSRDTVRARVLQP